MAKLTREKFGAAVGEYGTRLSLKHKIKRLLVKGLEIGGIDVKVGTEAVPGTRLWRISAISPQFAKLRPSERQDLVWRILSDSLTRDEQLQISMVLTLTPAELSGKWDD